jgi:hypothetical protein
METTRTREVPQQRPPRARKIPLDSDLYCPHSVRASEGNFLCDHDFNSAPTVRETKFAVWNCTRCGRAFKYETWGAQSRRPCDPTGAAQSRQQPGRIQAAPARSQPDPIQAAQARRPEELCAVSLYGADGIGIGAEPAF